MSDQPTNKSVNKLAGYKSLHAWNIQDAQAVLGFDKLFLSLAIVGFATAYVQYPDFVIVAAVGSGLLLTYWILLATRYRARGEDRFRVMKDIEREYKLLGHRCLNDDLPCTLSDTKLRKRFYWACIGLIALAVLWHYYTRC